MFFIVLSNFIHKAILVNDQPTPFCHKINHPDLNNAYFASLWVLSKSFFRPVSPIYQLQWSKAALPIYFTFSFGNFVVLSKEQEVVGLVKLASNAPRWSKGEHDLNVVDFLTSWLLDISKVVGRPWYAVTAETRGHLLTNWGDTTDNLSPHYIHIT